MSGQVCAAATIPFRIGENAGKRLAVDIFGRQIEVEFQAGGGGFGKLAKADFIGVVRGLFGAVIVIILNPAVQVDEFGPRQDRLELMQDKAVVAVGLIGAAAFGAVGFGAFGFFGDAIGGAGLYLGFGGKGHVAQVGPQGHGAKRFIAARGFGGQVGQGAIIAQGVADMRLDRGFSPRKDRAGTQCQSGFAKV